MASTTTQPSSHRPAQLAAAVLRAGDSAEALALVEGTTLPSGPGVSAGLSCICLGSGTCAGRPAAARLAWESASQADGR